MTKKCRNDDNVGRNVLEPAAKESKMGKTKEEVFGCGEGGHAG